jgi:hypothetical protein
VQTRIMALVIPAIIGLLVSLGTGNWGYLALVGLTLLVGATLDLALYGPIVFWQPPWLTGILGLGEYVIVLVLAIVLDFGVPFWAATLFYWGIWVVAQWSRIVILPLIFLTRIEDGGQIRGIEWTIPPRMQQLPVLAQPERLPERLSGVWSRPSQMGQALPAPSQAGRIPPELLGGAPR